MSDHDSVVYVLGAGFSASAGHPLMSQFAGVVQELTTNNASALAEDEREKFQRVLNYRWQMHKLYAYLNLDLDNLEHLFSLIDMESSLMADDDNPSTLRDDLIFVLVKTLELTLRKDPGLEDRIRPHLLEGNRAAVRNVRREGSHYTARYKTFVSRLRAHDTVLTFNYDTVLEDAMLVGDVSPDYYIANPDWRTLDPSVQVLKLHGSSNFIEREGGQLEVVNHELLDRTTDRYYAKGQPFLIPPTWNKSLLQDKVRQLWAQAGRALRTASRIAFIGYSLPETDLSFRYLLADALADNDGLRAIFVIDPSEDTRQRYEGFIAEVFKRQGKLRQFSNTLQDGLPADLYRP